MCWAPVVIIGRLKTEGSISALTVDSVEQQIPDEEVAQVVGE
jgi:hypothetical protein